MSRIPPVVAGLTLGLLIGSTHAAWALLVATGAAQTVLNAIFRLHFIRPPFVLDGFDPIIAAVLVGLTTLSGFVLGWLFGVIWNAFARLRTAG